MKKTNKLLSGLLALAMVGASLGGVASAATLTKMSSDAINNTYGDRMIQTTADADLFTVDGREFIMLDSMEDGSYFIMANESYGTDNFDPDSTQKYDIEDDNNIGNYTSVTVWNDGGDLVLPQGIKEHALLTTWETEPGTRYGNIPEQYSFEAQIALISATEYTQYVDKIGMTDLGKAWATRTADVTWDAADHRCVICIAQNSNTGLWATGRWAITGAFQIRPVMYIDNDFFTDVKLDVSSVGDNVKTMLRENYSRDEVAQAGYSSSELDILFGAGADSDLPMIESVTLEGTGDTTTTMTANAVLGANAASVNYQWQTSDDGQSFSDISGETGNELYITSAYASRDGEVGSEITRYLRMKATPVGEDGETLGEPVYSEAKQMPNSLGPKSTKYKDRSNKAGLAATDEKYIFTLSDAADGEGKKFILINAEEDGSYFVMGYDIYSNSIKFDGNSDGTKRQKYDPTVETNIGYYVENELWKGGTVGTERIVTLDLPQAIKDHAVLKTWRTEKGINNNNAPSDYAFDAYVTLLSATEWEQYKDIIGVNDTGKDWWLRTAMGTYETASATDNGARNILGFRPGTAQAGLNMGSADPNWAGLAIRPVMYLDNDFFTDVKIDVYTVGSAVKSIMTTAYTEEELQGAGYTSQELDVLYDRVDKPAITSVSISGENLFGGQIISSEVSYDEKTASVRYQWQESSDGNIFSNIANANGSEFEIGSQGGKYVRLAVTPVNAEGVSGDTVYSNALLIEPALSKVKYTDINDSGKVKATTDAADIFTVGSRKFIMLDSNEEGEFFVMTYDAYGRTPFDSNNTQKYDIEDENNIGYYVNNTVLNGTAADYPILSDIIKSHMVEKIWRTEPGTYAGDIPNEYSFSSKIALISATEYLEYADKIGLVDEMPGVWATRTAGTRWDNGDKSYSNVICFAGGKAAEWDNDTGSYYVRPVMYLDRSFFLDAAIPADQLGANVIEIMKNVYSPAELKTVYSKEDLNIYFGISDYEIQNASALRDGNSWTVTADVVSTSEGETNAIFIAAVYDETGETLKGIASDTIVLSDGSVNKALTVSAEGASDTDIVKVMLWDSWRTIVPLCEQAIITQ